MYTLSLSTPTVPAPIVAITLPSDDPIYAGSSVTLTCTIDLDQSVDTDVTITTTWKRSNNTITDSDRITITDANLVFPYQTTLTISHLSRALDEGDYSCEASITANPLSRYIRRSTTATATQTLAIRGDIPIFL